eukprot:TRINITY_DN6834_c0_g1_i2.p1 TRINITY_DN6834_c0_g1~~TRINITY_DN6834_c0_g1_i2.p1  ORF type:complete len:142 (+),score=28.72 TRINITY_DN6834_c0_g1_i2:61-426(+)
MCIRDRYMGSETHNPHINSFSQGSDRSFLQRHFSNEGQLTLLENIKESATTTSFNRDGTGLRIQEGRREIDQLKMELDQEKKLRLFFEKSYEESKKQPLPTKDTDGFMRSQTMPVKISKYD